MHPDTTVARLMSQTSWSWSTAQGTLDHWLCRAAVEALARDLFASLGETAKVSDAGTTPPGFPLGASNETSASVISCDRVNELQRVERLLPGSSQVFSVIVVRGATWWQRIGTEIASNRGNKCDQVAGLNYRALLQPVAVATYYDLVPLSQDNLIGRRCTKVLARLITDGSSDVSYRHGAGRFGMLPGGTDFHLWVDSANGVLLRAAKLLRGHEVEVLEWRDLIFDGVLDSATFEPPTAD